MNRDLFVLFSATLLLVVLINNSSCKHYPFEDVPDSDTPQNDTTNIPCDPEVVYFDQQILPILISNCAISGCHDQESQEDGVILDSYSAVMSTAEVVPFQPGESELYEVLVEDDPEDAMPQPPVQPLSQVQIQLIETWIAQGAKDLNCDPDYGDCDTTDVSFSGYVFPIVQNHCLGCHGPVNPVGGISLDTHSSLKEIALSGQLFGVISSQPGFSPMPQGGAQLSDCRIDKIKAWIDADAPNN